VTPPLRQGNSDVIGAGDDRDRAAPATGPAGAWRWVPLCVAFALGIAVGAAGWDRWRDISEERSRRSAVTIAAELGTVFGPATNQGERTISMVARLRNTGPLPVEVVRIGLDVPGLVIPPGSTQAALTIQPGTTESLRFARILRCEELAVVGDEPLVLLAKTADGRTRERRLVLRDAVLRIGQFARRQCERRDLDLSSSFLGSLDWTGVTWDRRARVVRTAFTVAPVAGAGATITGVESPTLGWTVAAEGLPIEVAPRTRGTVEVVWRVADCVSAQRLDLAEQRLEVLGQRLGGRALSTEVPVDAQLAAQLGRLLDSECPGS
jgi:hypothetical protein